MNISNFTKKEKVLLGLVVLSFFAFFGAVAYKFFLSEVTTSYWWQLGWDYDAAGRKNWIDLAISLVFIIFGNSFVFGVNALTVSGYWKFSRKLPDEFEIRQIQESSQLSLAISAIVGVSAFLVFTFSKTVQNHIFEDRSSHEYLAAALHNSSNYIENINRALRLDYYESRSDFMLGAKVIIVSQALAIHIARLWVWLKYR